METPINSAGPEKFPISRQTSCQLRRARSSIRRAQASYCRRSRRQAGGCAIPAGRR